MNKNKLERDEPCKLHRSNTNAEDRARERMNKNQQAETGKGNDSESNVAYIGCESEADKLRVDKFHAQVLKYTAREKRAAQIIDQICPIIADELNAHIGPQLFKKLTVRLTELL